ncbi:MAG: HesA/MoeB/ThiF family protein [Candidatus Bathyarchaeia archaeon]
MFAVITMDLAGYELERYDRQLKIGGWGKEGQMKLKSSKVVVAGAGGLGCPASIYLVASGFGKVRIIDDEKVELSNLNRQILHWTNDIGVFKVDSASLKLRSLNPNVEVEGLKCKITRENVHEMIKGFNVVVDAMDNYRTRYILNEACIREGIPFIHGAVYGFEGQLTTIIPHITPCLSCIFPQVPPEVEKPPVVGTTPALIATLQVTEAIKLITGIGKNALGRLLIYDGTDMSFQEIKVQRNPECPVCGP